MKMNRITFVLLVIMSLVFIGGLIVTGYFIGKSTHTETDEEKQKWGKIGAGLGAVVGIIFIGGIYYYYFYRQPPLDDNILTSRIMTSRKEQTELENLLPGIFDQDEMI